MEKLSSACVSVSDSGIRQWHVYRWVCIGMCFSITLLMLAELTVHDMRAGSAHDVRAWPASSQLPRGQGRPTCLLFLHPHCPCAQTSFAQLDETIGPQLNNWNLQFILVCPSDAQSDWWQGTSWRRAKQYPSATISIDTDGVEAARFGAETSGHCVLVDKSGTIVFCGGLTPSRGHLGLCPAIETIQKLNDGRAVGFQSAPVFGCPLTEAIQSTQPTTGDNPL